MVCSDLFVSHPGHSSALRRSAFSSALLRFELSRRYQLSPLMLRFLIISTLFLFVRISSAPCKMSPLTTFLSDSQQQTLHQLIVTARNAGETEEMVKESMDEYLSQVLSPQRLLEFKAAHDEFEAQRRGKRATSSDKPEPKKVFDIIDLFTSDYQKFYEEPVAVRNRNSR